MLQQLFISLRCLLLMTVLTGFVYPYAVTAVAQLAFPRQANGSVVLKDGNPAGSELIGQSFDDPKYFWGRLSALSPAYNAATSSGSNLGPLNPALTAAVQARIDALKVADPDNRMPIPVDLATASGSGLDPEISPAAAYYQAARVARARRISEETVQNLIRRYTRPRTFGLMGEPGVNVLLLNLALDDSGKGS